MADESAILLTISLAYLFSSYLYTMKDQANPGITENLGTSDLPVTSELKAMFADLLEGAKKDILSNVQESIDQIYADFEYVETKSEGPQNQVNPEANTDTAVATKIDNFIQLEPSDLGEGSSSDSLKRLLRRSVLQKKQLQPLIRVCSWRNFLKTS